MYKPRGAFLCIVLHSAMLHGPLTVLKPWCQNTLAKNGRLKDSYIVEHDNASKFVESIDIFIEARGNYVYLKNAPCL